MHDAQRAETKLIMAKMQFKGFVSELLSNLQGLVKRGYPCHSSVTKRVVA